MVVGIAEMAEGRGWRSGSKSSWFLHDEALLLDVMHANRHCTPVSCHGHRDSMMSVGQSMSMRSTRSDAIVLGLGTLRPTDTAPRIVKSRTPINSLRVVIVTHGTGAR